MFNQFDTIIFDLDGTIYNGNTLIDGALEVIEHVKKSGKKIFFLTNTSFKNRKSITKKLNDFSIECDINQVYTSGYISGIYVKEQNLTHPFLYGSEELKEEYLDLGIKLTTESEAENLIIAFHPGGTFEDLSSAYRVALKARKIIAVNVDRSVPLSNGLSIPGCGAMVKALEYSANRTIDEIIGKPNPLMIEMLIEEKGLTRDKIVMIGDSFESDIVMSNNANIKSILISDFDFKHDYTVPSIKNLLTIL